MTKASKLLKNKYVQKEMGSSELGSRESVRKETFILAKVLDVIEVCSSFAKYFSIRGLVLTASLLTLVLMSAIGVVYSSHLSRQLFSDQAVLLEKNDQMQLEWAQLLLEQSAWSAPNRIETVAGEKLEMTAPNARDVQLIY